MFAALWLDDGCMDDPPNKLLDDCFAHDKKRLRHAEALAILKERVRPVVGVELVALAEAAGRILATAAVAPRPVPAHTNAAVDGFSFAASDCDAAAGARLVVEGRAAAGHPLAGGRAGHGGAHLHGRRHARGARHRRHAGGRACRHRRRAGGREHSRRA